MNQGGYYNDPEWVAGHLADLAHAFRDVHPFVKIILTKQAGGMGLDYQRRPERIAQAARLDGKWVLVTNQPLIPGQSCLNYTDWMLRAYKNHCHVERRMRNLKSDLPIRPFLFSSAMTVSDTAACLAAVDLLEESTELVDRLCENARHFQRGMGDLGFDTGKTQTPITGEGIGSDLMKDTYTYAAHSTDYPDEVATFTLHDHSLSVELGGALLTQVERVFHLDDAEGEKPCRPGSSRPSLR